MAKRYTRDDLNEKQGKFVDEYIARGGTRHGATEAIMVAYGYDKATATSAANRMLKNEKIKDVLVEETVASFAAMGALAADKLLDVLTTGMWFGQPVKPSDGLKAISQALERGIGPIAQIHQHSVEHKTDGLSGQELRAQIVAELRKIPDQDRAAMLKALGAEDIIDIDAVEIDPKAPWGRKSDGSPRKKPGQKGIEKRVLPGPEAYKPPKESPLDKRIKALKEKKRRERARAEQE